MALLDRLRPSTFLAARPNPKPPPDLPLDADEIGDLFGGANRIDYVSRLATQIAPLLTSRELDSRRIEAMRRDYQVSACLTVLSMPLLRADWSIECEDDDMREQIAAAYGIVHADLIRSACRALPWGYSPNVLVWTVDPDLGMLTPRKIRDLPPETMEPLVDRTSGGFAGMVQNRGRDGEERIEDPLLCLWITEGMESGNLYGRSVLEAALEPWQDKLATRLFHLRYLERFGEPVVRTRAPSGQVIVNEAEIAAAAAAGTTIPAAVYERNLDRALEMGESLRHHSVVALPSDRTISADGKDIGYSWDLDYLESSRSGGADFREALDEHNRAIARALFVPDLLFANTDGGAYALGREHRSVFDAAVEGRLDDWSRQITRHLIDRVRVFNYGERSPRAELVFGGVTDTDRAELWQLATELVRGNRLPVEIEELAARLGIPLQVADEDEGVSEAESSPFADVGLPALVEAYIISPEEARELIGITGPAPAVPALPAAPADLSASQRAAVRASLGLPPGGRVELAAPPADVTGLPDYRVPQAFDPPPGFHREMNARERRVGLARVEREMNVAEAATIDALAELLERQRERVLRQIRGIMGKGSTAEQLTALSTLDLGSSTGAASAWDRLMRDVWTVGLDSVRTELEAFAATVPTGLNAEGRALVSTYATASAERHLASLSTELRLEVVSAMRSDVTRAGIEAIVGDLYDRELRSEGRPLRLTTRNLSARALNEGRADAIERGGIPLRGAQYSSLLDRRVCELCRRQDEQVIPIEHTDYRRFTPPVHHQCRCVWIYITRDEADFTPTWSTPPTSLVEQYGSLVY